MLLEFENDPRGFLRVASWIDYATTPDKMKPKFRDYEVFRNLIELTWCNTEVASCAEFCCFHVPEHSPVDPRAGNEPEYLPFPLLRKRAYPMATATQALIKIEQVFNYDWEEPLW